MDARQRVEELLKPDGELLGVPGRRRGVRVVEGSAEEARTLFEELVGMGQEVLVGKPTRGSRLGRLVEIPDLGYVGYREESTSGEPTVDCRVSVEALEKVKFKFVGVPREPGERST